LTGVTAAEFTLPPGPCLVVKGNGIRFGQQVLHKNCRTTAAEQLKGRYRGVFEESPVD